MSFIFIRPHMHRADTQDCITCSDEIFEAWNAKEARDFIRDTPLIASFEIGKFPPGRLGKYSKGQFGGITCDADINLIQFGPMQCVGVPYDEKGSLLDITYVQTHFGNESWGQRVIAHMQFIGTGLLARCRSNSNFCIVPLGSVMLDPDTMEPVYRYTSTGKLTPLPRLRVIEGDKNKCG